MATPSERLVYKGFEKTLNDINLNPIKAFSDLEESFRGTPIDEYVGKTALALWEDPKYLFAEAFRSGSRVAQSAFESSVQDTVLREAVAVRIASQAVPSIPEPGMREGVERGIKAAALFALSHHTEFDTTIFQLQHTVIDTPNSPRWPAKKLIEGLGYTVHMIDFSLPKAIDSVLNAETSRFNPDKVKWQSPEA